MLCLRALEFLWVVSQLARAEHISQPFHSRWPIVCRHWCSRARAKPGFATRSVRTYVLQGKGQIDRRPACCFTNREATRPYLWKRTPWILRALFTLAPPEAHCPRGTMQSGSAPSSLQSGPYRMRACSNKVALKPCS
ncbi:hypothetical protein V8C26DRAFT_395011 [Trichoderma gracile]